MTTVKEKTVSFWDGNHPRQKEYELLYGKLVPEQGEADTVNGELVRCISRFFWDYCNNGNMNAVETEETTCGNCNGDMTIEGCPYCKGGEDDCEECEGNDTVDCDQCDGSGIEEGGKVVTEYYRKMLDYLIKHIGQEARDVETFLTLSNSGQEDCKYSQKDMDIYNEALAKVLDYCATTSNKSLEV